MNRIDIIQAKCLGEIEGIVKTLDWGLINKNETIKQIKAVLEKYNKIADEVLAGYGLTKVGMN